MFLGSCLRCKRKFEYPHYAQFEVHNPDIHRPNNQLKCPHCGNPDLMLDERDPIMSKVKVMINNLKREPKPTWRNLTEI